MRRAAENLSPQLGLAEHRDLCHLSDGEAILDRLNRNADDMLAAKSGVELESINYTLTKLIIVDGYFSKSAPDREAYAFFAGPIDAAQIRDDIEKRTSGRLEETDDLQILASISNIRCSRLTRINWSVPTARYITGYSEIHRRTR